MGLLGDMSFSVGVAEADGGGAWGVTEAGVDGLGVCGGWSLVPVPHADAAMDSTAATAAETANFRMP